MQLRLEKLTDKAKQDAASNALEVRCLQAEAEVVELKEKDWHFGKKGRISCEPDNHFSYSGALFSLCLQWSGKRAHGSGLSFTWESNEWAGHVAGAYCRFGGARSPSTHGTIRYLITQLYSNAFHWDRIGAERARARPILGGTRYECRASPKVWKGYGCRRGRLRPRGIHGYDWCIQHHN